MAERSIEELLPKMTRVLQSFTTEIEYLLRLIRKDLAPHETLVVKSRIKDCGSAIDKLRRREPGGVFDRDMPDKYSLLALRDLVGVRVLVFPSKRADAIDIALRGKFQSWKADTIEDRGKRLAFKYNGMRHQDRIQIPCEYQIVSTLIGLFWEVEHAALYKQSPNLKGLAPLMAEQTLDVYQALKSFESEFERQIERSSDENQ
jgi:ppGpp synthetase/RelA/SpoT-type nucleotidyltranferase